MLLQKSVANFFLAFSQAFCVKTMASGGPCRKRIHPCALRVRAARGHQPDFCGEGALPVQTPMTSGRLFRFSWRRGEGRRGRESNPRIEVLQTPTLPLGYPAEIANRSVGACSESVNEPLSSFNVEPGVLSGLDV